MSVEENKAIIRRLAEEGWPNPDILREFIDTDVAMHGPQPDGLEAYKQGMSAFVAGIPDCSWTVDDLIAEGDKVVIRWTHRGTHTEELWGIPPTSKQVTIEGVTTHRIADGKVVEVWNLWNVPQFFRHIGVSEPWQELIRLAKANQE
jgi:steroid delta-isomerase-like uncharacterized protein